MNRKTEAAGEEPIDNIDSEIDSIYDSLYDDDAPEPEKDEGAISAKDVAEDDDASESQEGEPTGDDTEAREAEAESAGLDAPEDWSETDRAAFGTLTPQAQEFVLRRHREMQSDYTSKTQAIADLEKAFEPYQQHLDMQRLGRADAVKYLLSAHQALQRDPVSTLAWLAKGQIRDPAVGRSLVKKLVSDLGLGSVGGEDDSSFDEDQEDPRSKLAEEFRGELAGLKEDIARRDQEQVVAYVQAWGAETDAKGAPLRPHFEQVRNAMSVLITNGLAQDLDEAYAKATRAEGLAGNGAAPARAAPGKSAAAARAAATPRGSAGKKAAGVRDANPAKGEDLAADIEAVYNHLSS